MWECIVSVGEAAEQISSGTKWSHYQVKSQLQVYWGWLQFRWCYSLLRPFHWKLTNAAEAGTDVIWGMIKVVELTKKLQHSGYFNNSRTQRDLSVSENILSSVLFSNTVTMMLDKKKLWYTGHYSIVVRKTDSLSRLARKEEIHTCIGTRDVLLNQLECESGKQIHKFCWN